MLKGIDSKTKCYSKKTFLKNLHFVIINNKNIDEYKRKIFPEIKSTFLMFFINTLDRSSIRQISNIK